MFRKLLRNQKLASALLFGALIAIVWFVGPLLGMTAAESRLAWIVVLMIVWVAILLVGKVLSERAAGLLEAMLRRQGDDAVMAASPEKRAEVAALRTRLLGAIDTLKKSNVGKTRGKAALYELPWYMIIGHPSAGKSSAIANSGLTFPLAEKGAMAIPGIGGTRNCDWFFSTEGVLIDTAGRYSTQREDRQEWLQFLKLLRKHRPRAPLNGILVAVSFPELAQHKSEAFAAYARQIRERISEVDDTFGVKLPVYLVFTKLDLLGGFAQFFENMSEEERHGVWGATLPHEQGTDFDASRVVARHVELLYRGLQKRGAERLAVQRDGVARPTLFSFPMEFHAIKEGVARFVGILFEDDPYHTRPLLRGVYFTSALQEGLPKIAAGGRVASQFDLARGGFESAQAPSSHSFFLRDLFRDVVFADQHLVGRQTSPTHGRARLAGIAAGLAIVAMVLAAWSWSYLGNRQLIETAAQELATARQLARSADSYENLRALQILQDRVEQLHQYRQGGRPWSLRYGLYRGDEVERAVRAEYFAGIRRLMLAPVASELQARLSAVGGAGPVRSADAGPVRAAYARGAVRPASLRDVVARLDDPDGGSARPAGAARQAGLDEAYNALKTYLMLQDRARLDAAHLADQLPRYWRPWLAGLKLPEGGDATRIAERAVSFYLTQLGAPDLPLIDANEPVVSAARQVLRSEMKRLSAKERIYNELKARGNTQFQPMTVARLLDNKHGDLLGGSHAVPGSFTREAWEGYFREAIAEAARGEVRGDDWVMASAVTDNLGADGDAARNRAALEAMYRAEFAAEWRKFLQGVVVHDFAGLQGAASAVGRLADPAASPLKLLLQRAAYQTAWDNPSGLRQGIESARSTVVEKTGALIAGSSRPAGARVELGEVGEQFALLAALSDQGVDGAAKPAAGMVGYLERLARIRARLTAIAATDEPGVAARQFMQATITGQGSELSDGLQFIDAELLGGASESARDYLRPLLVRPLMNTFAALIPPTEEEINRAWATDVYGAWSSLARKYPFADSNNEATVVEMSRFFKPGDGLLARFVSQQLGTLVSLKGDSVTPRTWGAQGVRFNPTFLAGMSRLVAASGAFQEGESARFELQPVPTPGLSEIAIEIDGQPLRYRNGPQVWKAFAWPGGSAVSGARLQVTAFNGTTSDVASFGGRLAFMRLLTTARAVDGGALGSGQLQWRAKGASGNDDGPLIRMNFRHVGGANPLAILALRRLALPATVTH